MNTSRHRIFIGLELSGYLTSTIPMVKSTIVDNKNLIKRKEYHELLEELPAKSAIKL